MYLTSIHYNYFFTSYYHGANRLFTSSYREAQITFSGMHHYSKDALHGAHATNNAWVSDVTFPFYTVFAARVAAIEFND